MVLISFTLMVYLAVSAPPPLLEENPIERTLPIQTVFSIVEAENDVVRELWTSEIVGAGKLVGLQFKEDWRERGVEAGPLPALFLRETAKNLETMPVRLSLGLGSDFPIKSINRFEGKLKEKFQKIKATGEPQFFFDEDTGLYFASFPDIAVVHSCVQCHNEHEQSSKHDWKLNDVMGATSWSYPSGHVSWEEAIEIVTALRKSVRQAYTAYLAKTASFAKKPAIGEKWPREGLYLPSAEVFMRKIAELTSAQTLEAFLSVAEPFSEIQVVYAQERVGN
jgi:adenylate cyclase